MSGFDWLVVIVMGVVGWLVVSFLLNRSKPPQEGDDQSAPPRPDAFTPRLPAPAPVPAAVGVDTDAGDASEWLSLDEIGRSWHLILAVSSDAPAGEIESAYHAKLAECDRVRFSADATPGSRKLAEQQRARINQAYEFIRPSRQ
jgi:hypothetical protein